MKKFNKSIIVACILPLALGSTAVLAYNNSHYDGDGCGSYSSHSNGRHHSNSNYNNYQNNDKGWGTQNSNRNRHGSFSQLNLSVDQQNELDTLRNEFQQQMNEHSNELRSLRQQERYQLQQDKFDERATANLANQIADIQVQRKVAKAKYRNEMYNLLTPQQQQQMKNNRSYNY